MMMSRRRLSYTFCCALLPAVTPFSSLSSSWRTSSSSFVPPLIRKSASAPTTSPSSFLLHRSPPRTTGTTASSTSTTALQLSPSGITPAVTAAAAAASAPLASIAVLALIVTIHEAGHYLSSKLFGVRVEEFSVGFGPKLASFTVWGDEFNLRALPLGGYVRFPENYNATLARETEEAEFELAAEFLENRRRATDPSWGARILNAVTLGAVDDKLWADEKKRRQQQQQQASASSSTDSAKSQPLSTWWNKIFKRDRATKEANLSQKVPGEIEYYDDPNLLQNRPWPQRAVVLSGGILFNLLLAFCIYFGQINLGPGLPVPVFDEGIVVTAVPRTDAAANGILRQGDVIVAVDGIPVATNFMSNTEGGVAAARRSAVSASDSQKAISDLIAQIRATPEGESLTLDVKHGGAVRAKRANSALAASDSTSIQLQQQQQPALDRVRVQPKRVNNGDNAGPMTIGVLLSPNYAGTEVWKTSNPVEAAQLSLQYVTSMTQETASGLFSFFAGFVAGGGSGGGGGGAQVSGPIGLIRTGSEVVATQDWTAVLLFAAAISINLGVINAVPLPALDGGQLVFVLAEALTGRKVNQRFQEGVTGVAVLFLLLLSAGTFVGDVSSIFGR